MSIPSRLGALAFCAVLCAVLIAAAPSSLALDLGSLWPRAGSGSVVTKSLQPAPFEAVQLKTSAAVEIRQGPATGVVIEADDNILALIDVEVRDDTLVIEDTKSFSATKLRITITAPRIGRIAGSGSTAVSVGPLVAPRLSLSASGSSALRFESLTAETLSLQLGGSSAVSLAGLVNDISAQLGGSAALKASGLESRTARITMGGSSVATVWAKNKLQATLGGSSSLAYHGAPELAVSTGGSASVRRVSAEPPHRPVK